ncbi:Non-heme 11 kDa protein of cytochrome bc1 complex [Microthyrium microscopicum]|uniref:Non-heme 11 kDa protein of cytochrome bc1 complex n=1 Tax=Microthyrium microscopicum TaxID=703497 RepID=A0A6A6UTN8_9PEZI|nr:Non-heme 11 kDa protein of cytochrome bc1 complex [Microthyrium microscopicum]
MGFLDTLASFVPFSEAVHADAPPKDEPEDAAPADDSEDKSKDEESEEDAPAEEDAAEEPAEEEEEEEEEPEDPKEKLETECKESAQCSKYKSHYDHCAKRVDEQVEKNGKPEEDCVEEFFELVHCATNCAAPQLWKLLK